jgi:hypothetical protein
MGSGAVKQASERAVSALERINVLESRFSNFEKGVGSAFEQTEDRLGHLEEMMTALINLTGPEQVRDEVVRIRVKQQESALEAAKQGLKESVDLGVLIPALAIPTSTEVEANPELMTQYLVVCQRKDSQGNTVGIGRSQLALSSFTPEVRIALYGVTPGTVVPIANNETLTVEEVYVQNPDADRILRELAAKTAVENQSTTETE